MMDPIVGKPSPRRLERILKDCLGAPSAKVLVGPGPGLDAAVLDIGNERVMAVAEDPIFPAPNLPLEIMGRFTVHIGASDVAVTGIRPEFLTYTLLLPGTSTENEARTLVKSISRAARELNICIVGGHTGWYDAVNLPIVGGVTVWGSASKDQWISPGGAKAGDLILMTKGPAIEATALLSILYREKLADRIDVSTLKQALIRVNQITVVEDALTAFAAGGVHAMHDATEGGVLGGLWEMHAASGLSLKVDLDSVGVPRDIQLVSRALGFDPWKAISEGTLLAAVDPGRVENVRLAWKKAGLESHILGKFDSRRSENVIVKDGVSGDLFEPEKDPFWDLFFAGLQPNNKSKQ